MSQHSTVSLTVARVASFGGATLPQDVPGRRSYVRPVLGAGIGKERRMWATPPLAPGGQDHDARLPRATGRRITVSSKIGTPAASMRRPVVPIAGISPAAIASAVSSARCIRPRPLSNGNSHKAPFGAEGPTRAQLVPAVGPRNATDLISGLFPLVSWSG